MSCLIRQGDIKRRAPACLRLPTQAASPARQGFVKSRLNVAAVSQRDLQRVFTKLGFFIQHHNQRRQDLPDTVPAAPQPVVHRSLLLSIALVYYFRLSTPLRQDFLQEMAAVDATAREQQDDQVPC